MGKYAESKVICLMVSGKWLLFFCLSIEILRISSETIGKLLFYAQSKNKNEVRFVALLLCWDWKHTDACQCAGSHMHTHSHGVRNAGLHRLVDH